jgi:hypothetical protein
VLVCLTFAREVVVLKTAVRAGERNTDRSVKISRGDKANPLNA